MDAVYDDLLARGYDEETIFFAPRSTQPSDDPSAQERQALDEALVVVVVLSRHALRSGRLRGVLAQTLAKHRAGAAVRVVPVRLDDSRLPPALTGFQAIRLECGGSREIAVEALDTIFHGARVWTPERERASGSRASDLQDTRVTRSSPVAGSPSSVGLPSSVGSPSSVGLPLVVGSPPVVGSPLVVGSPPSTPPLPPRGPARRPVAARSRLAEASATRSVAGGDLDLTVADAPRSRPPPLPPSVARRAMLSVTLAEGAIAWETVCAIQQALVAFVDSTVEFHRVRAGHHTIDFRVGPEVVSTLHHPTAQTRLLRTFGPRVARMALSMEFELAGRCPSPLHP
ncbi:MAG: toll/interleukin-1 receptor domain-containing protein [Myxococcales bacterium]|nr:toll/interleukin-1 receptor domain-containing protein [Myxococcales bacterium]